MSTHLEDGKPEPYWAPEKDNLKKKLRRLRVAATEALVAAELLQDASFKDIAPDLTWTIQTVVGIQEQVQNVKDTLTATHQEQS